LSTVKGGGYLLEQFTGLPTVDQVPDGTLKWAKDTTGGGVYIVANDGGTIKTIGINNQTGFPADPVNSLQFNNAGVFGGTNFMEWDDVNTSLTVGSNVVTANKPVLFLGQSWNNAAVNFTGFQVWVSGTKADPSYIADFVYGAAPVFAIDTRNWLLLAETATIPTTPPAGYGYIYIDSATNGLSFINDAGEISFVGAFVEPPDNKYYARQG
jgi:hypothetical protein